MVPSTTFTLSSGGPSASCDFAKFLRLRLYSTFKLDKKKTQEG